MKSRILAMLLASVMIFAFGCKAKTPAGEQPVAQSPSGSTSELTCALANMPSNLDMPTAPGTSLLTFSSHVFNSLIGMDENYNLTPDIATSWKQVDDTTWTFEIGEGYVFSNGEKLEMDDIVYSIERLRNCPLIASYVSNIGAVTYEGRTLTIKLVAPNNLTIRTVLTTFCPILNKSYCEEKGESAILNAECGTGPYKVIEYVPGEKVVVGLREDYPFEKPSLTKITFKAILEPANRYIALETGEVQFATELAFKDFERANGNAKLKPSSRPASGLTFMSMNTKTAPFDNTNVRLAMAYAMDRESWCAIAEGVTPLMSMVSEAFPKCAVAPEGMPGFDLEKAKQLLAAEGYNESNPLQFEMQIYQPSPALEAYQATLKSIGVNATIKQYDKGTVLTMLRNGEGVMNLLTYYSVSGTPLFEAGCYKNDDTRNYSLFNNQELDDLINKALVTNDETEMVNYINQASAASVKYMPFIPICNQVLYTVMDSKLDGVVQRPDSSVTFVKASFH